MRLVALIILAPVSSKTDVTTSSYDGSKFLHLKDAPRCADHFITGFVENGRNHVEL